MMIVKTVLFILSIVLLLKSMLANDMESAYDDLFTAFIFFALSVGIQSV